MQIEFTKKEKQGWSMEECMKCPVCEYENKIKKENGSREPSYAEYYNHIYDTEFLKGHDNYDAWAGRGDLQKLRFWCESGHAYSLCFGFHKGNIITWWQEEGFDPHRFN